MSDTLEDRLFSLAAEHKMLGKGFLGLALVITQKAQKEGLPIDLDNLMTEGGGQVRGAGGGSVQRILNAHGIDRRLSAEGGRTSRGTPAKARALAAFLNANLADNPIELGRVTTFWVERIREFFASKPFAMHLDPALGVTGAIRSLIEQIGARQREMEGSTLVGTVLQHLVGAKLEIRLGLELGAIARHGASVNDAMHRGGDLEIGDTVIHVTTAPGQPVIEKCAHNARSGFRAIIVTSPQRLSVARALLSDNDLAGRVDVLDYEQFLAANIFESGRFEAKGRRAAIERIVERYNEIVALLETDPGLRIELH